MHFSSIYERPTSDMIILMYFIIAYRRQNIELAGEGHMLIDEAQNSRRAL